MSVTSQISPRFRAKDLLEPRDLAVGRDNADILLIPNCCNAEYQVGFACSRRSVEETLNLRYRVFNLELNEGLASSAITQMDRDEFDDQMTHLALIEKRSGQIVGTYRLQTISEAMSAKGLYSAQEFDLTPLSGYADSAVECGRACIERPHRSFNALAVLWEGISAFLKLTSHRYLFGCCSLTTSDPDDGWRCMKTLRRLGSLHPHLYLPAMPACSCGPASRESDPEIGGPIEMPKLFRIYLRLGAKVISEPAIDRDFGTVDFLILLDSRQVSDRKLTRLGRQPDNAVPCADSSCGEGQPEEALETALPYEQASARERNVG